MNKPWDPKKTIAENAELRGTLYQTAAAYKMRNGLSAVRQEKQIKMILMNYPIMGLYKVLKYYEEQRNG